MIRLAVPPSPEASGPSLGVSAVCAPPSFYPSSLSPSIPLPSLPLPVLPSLFALFLQSSFLSPFLHHPSVPPFLPHQQALAALVPTSPLQISMPELAVLPLQNQSCTLELGRAMGGPTGPILPQSCCAHENPGARLCAVT